MFRARETGRGLGAAKALVQRFAFLIFAAFAVGYAAAPGQAVAQSFSFSRVEVNGNQRVDAATIVSYAGIARGEPVSAAQLNDAYQNILASGLFESVEVVPRGGTLVINVREHPTINRIAFEGNRRVKDEDMAGVIRSQSRRVFQPSQVESDAAAITELYRVQGRVAATVTPKIIRRQGNRVDLVFEVTEGQTVENERISFVGNRRFSDRRLRGALETKQAGLFRQLIQRDTLIEERIDFDKQVLRDFYLSRGYIDFRVQSATAEITRNRDAFLVTFNVQEGQQFRIGRVTVTSSMPEVNAAEFRNALRIRSGRVYNPQIVETNISRMERLAARKGINFMRVEPQISRNERNQTLDINFAISKGPRIFVERIDIEGNASTLDRVVRRQFRVVEGDPFNPREIREAAERIRALGFFETADVNAREGSAPDQVVVDVDLVEAPTGSLGFGASYGSDDGLGFNVSFSERNFLGRGQALSFSFDTTSAANGLSFSFREPAFLGREVTFGLDANYRASESEFSRYDTATGLIRPLFEFPLTDRSRLQLRGTLAYRELSGIDLGDPEGNPGPAGDTGSSFILRQEEGQRWDASLGYTYIYDSRIVGLNPNAAVRFTFGQDFGGLDGENQYIRSVASMTAQTKIWNEEVTLRAELEGGALHYTSGGSTVLDRFSLNGKIRGFEANGVGPRDLNVTNEDALGGNYFFVARLEAEFPLGLPEEYGISGGVFYDIGSVWGLDDVGGGPTGANPVDDDLHWRSSVGLSVFWDTPIGPLRFNFSEVIMKQDYDKERNFDISIRTDF
ncbi:outer membrane protein assembly factor BamA [Vannielia litorea]|uniref:outer membrane protein assembly factor BamA n=1 Tax=Vannielia litorea TaxID=1217970 RepID=UPI001BCDD537|nr:outer membrane protein assembly factor BamA [Vannielia litorea]MBS8228654.1 outer membrane protein assembly factor BamA [Vannielia litorea]